MLVAVVSSRPEDVYADKLAWVVQGFREVGHQCVRCHTLAEVAAADKEADLVLFDHKGGGCCRNALAEMALSKRAVWAMWWRDLIAFEPGLPKQALMVGFRKLLQRMDVVFVKERTLVEHGEYAELGINAQWLDQACPAEMPPCEHREETDFDILIPGSTSYPQRCRDSRALVDAGFKVAWCGLGGAEQGCAGLGWLHPTKELPQAVSRAAVVLGVDWRCDVAGYTSDRTWLIAGMGACLVSRVADLGSEYGHAAQVEYNPQAEVAAWTYDSTDGLLACVRVALADPAQRRRRGEAARRAVMERHTYAARAREIVAKIASLPSRHAPITAN